VEAQAIALIANIWSQSGDMMSDLWPLFAFGPALAVAFAIGSWARGLF